MTVPSDLPHSPGRSRSSDRGCCHLPRTRSGLGSASAALRVVPANAVELEPGHRVGVGSSIAEDEVHRIGGSDRVGRRDLELLAKGLYGMCPSTTPLSLTRSRTEFWLSPNDHSVLPGALGSGFVGLDRIARPQEPGPPPAPIGIGQTFRYRAKRQNHVRAVVDVVLHCAWHSAARDRPADQVIERVVGVGDRLGGLGVNACTCRSSRLGSAGCGCRRCRL